MHLGRKKPDEPRGAFMQIYPFLGYLFLYTPYLCVSFKIRRLLCYKWSIFVW